MTIIHLKLEFGGRTLSVEPEAEAYLMGEGAYLLGDCRDLLDVLVREIPVAAEPEARVLGVFNPEDDSTTILIQVTVSMAQSKAFDIESQIEERFAQHTNRIPSSISVAIMAR